MIWKILLLVAFGCLLLLWAGYRFYHYLIHLHERNSRQQQVQAQTEALRLAYEEGRRIGAQNPAKVIYDFVVGLANQFRA